MLFASAKTRAIVLMVVGLAIVAVGSRFVTGTAIRGDARENLQMALNLQRHGVVSLHSQPPLQPSMFREPIPIIATAGAIHLVDNALGEAGSSQYFAGRRVQWLKYQDLIWLLSLYFAAFWAVGLFSNSFALRVVAATLVCLPQLLGGSSAHGGLDKLYSDVLAAFLLLLSSGMLVCAARSRKLGYAALTGIFFGFLALTKASTLYVFVGVLAVFLAYLLVDRHLIPARRGVFAALTMALAFLATIAPWMYRNHQQFGVYRIAERGGIVLMTRAIQDLMTPVEMRGAFFVWAPSGVKAVVRRVLGFRNEDLDAGGRLQRLNQSNRSAFSDSDRAAQWAGRPDLAMTYFRKGLAEHRRLTLIHQARGDPNPSSAADADLQKHAMEIIKQHPFRHWVMTIPFLWRGAFYSFPVLLVVLVHAIRTHHHDLALFIAPAFGTIMFYALLSHFIPRYGLAMVPVAIIAAVLFAKKVWDERTAQVSPVKQGAYPGQAPAMPKRN